MDWMFKVAAMVVKSVSNIYIFAAMLIVVSLLVMGGKAVVGCVRKVFEPSEEEQRAMYEAERRDTEAYIDSIMNLPAWKTLDAALADSLGTHVLAWYGFDDSYAPAPKRTIEGSLGVKYRDKLVSVVASYVETPDGKGEIREMWFKDSDGNPVDIHKVEKVK